MGTGPIFSNRLITVTTDGTKTADYFYDALNRRIKKDLTSGDDVIYLYDGWRCIEELEEDGGVWTTARQHVYGGQYVDGPLIRDKDTDSDDGCVDFARQFMA